MGSQEQHELHAPTFVKVGAVGYDFHALARRIEARGHSTGTTPGRHFDHTETTSSIRHKPLVMTQGWNTNSRLLRGFQDAGSSFYTNFNTVNGKGLHRNHLTNNVLRRRRNLRIGQDRIIYFI
jgi:hypothetical protein